MLTDKYLKDLKEGKTRDPQLEFLQWLDDFKIQMLKRTDRILGEITDMKHRIKKIEVQFED